MREIDLGLIDYSEIPDSFDEWDETAIVDYQVGWFLANFEDPAQSTPYDGREGGYQYVWGGPYNATDELYDTFGDRISEKMIDKAVEDVQSDGVIDWAPNHSRINHESDGDDKIISSPIDRLAKALGGLEAALVEVAPLASTIGGNNPPENIGTPPYTDEQHEAVLKGIQILRDQMSSESPDILRIETESRRFEEIGKAIVSYFAVKADKFVNGAATGAGTILGITAAASLTDLADKLLKVAQVVGEYVASLSLPF